MVMGTGMIIHGVLLITLNLIIMIIIQTILIKVDGHSVMETLVSHFTLIKIVTLTN